MQLMEGSVVRSMAGHDAGIFAVIVGSESGWPLIADGNGRKLEAPKRKNPKHLTDTGEQIDLSAVHSNKQLRRLLRPFRNGETGPELE